MIDRFVEVISNMGFIEVKSSIDYYPLGGTYKLNISHKQYEIVTSYSSKVGFSWQLLLNGIPTTIWFNITDEDTLSQDIDWINRYFKPTIRENKLNVILND